MKYKVGDRVKWNYWEWIIEFVDNRYWITYPYKIRINDSTDYRSDECDLELVEPIEECTIWELVEVRDSDDDKWSETFYKYLWKYEDWHLVEWYFTNWSPKWYKQIRKLPKEETKTEKIEKLEYMMPTINDWEKLDKWREQSINKLNEVIDFINNNK